MAYSAQKWATPHKRPIAQKSQPMRFPEGVRGTITAPTVEKPAENRTFSIQKE